MAILNPTNYTFTRREVQTLSECIFEALFQKQAITEFHQVFTGIKANKQIVFLGKLGLLGKEKTTCSTTADTASIDISEKVWTPKYIAARIEDCWTDLEASFFAWATKNGVNKTDITDTDFANFVEERLTDAAVEAAWRIAWFGDTDAANYSDSPAGYITDGISVDYFNPIDGFWKQLYAVGTANAARLVANLTTKNGQATYALQAFNSTDLTNRIATGTLHSLKVGSDFRLRDRSDLIYLVTQSVFDQYAYELEMQGVDSSFKRIEGGFTALSYNGIPVVAVNFFDRMISLYQDSGTNNYRPHRAILTTTENLGIGVEEVSNLSEVAAFYAEYEEKYVAKFAFNIDAKVLEDYMVQLAY
jgi:hypothetical protein